MAERTPSIDKRQARRAFSRAADTYDQAAVLQREIGERMLERLDYVKIEPATVLDAGCGTGVAADALARRYKKARIIALDFALPMLRQARRRGPWLRKPLCICGDIEQLPLPGIQTTLPLADTGNHSNSTALAAVPDDTATQHITKHFRRVSMTDPLQYREIRNVKTDNDSR